MPLYLGGPFFVDTLYAADNKVQTVERASKSTSDFHYGDSVGNTVAPLPV